MRGFGSTRIRPRLKGSKGKLPTTKVPRGLTFLVVQLVGEFEKPVVAIQRVPPRATVAPRRLEPRRLAPSAVWPSSPVANEQKRTINSPFSEAHEKAGADDRQARKQHKATKPKSNKTRQNGEGKCRWPKLYSMNQNKRSNTAINKSVTWPTRSGEASPCCRLQKELLDSVFLLSEQGQCNWTCGDWFEEACWV